MVCCLWGKFIISSTNFPTIEGMFKNQLNTALATFTIPFHKPIQKFLNQSHFAQSNAIVAIKATIPATTKPIGVQCQRSV